jgi:hypothetical protein
MGWPQITFIVLYALNIVFAAALHGQPKSGNWNVLSVVISSAISITILYFGGFWG